MKKLAFIVLVCLFTFTENFAQQEVKFAKEDSFVGFYRQFSTYTDPGKYAYLYTNLPDSLHELCKLISSQFIHPFAELPRYKNVIPKERWRESIKYPTVSFILEGLIFYNSKGLVYDRKPEERLVLGCRHNAILLASILKYRGIPARIRAGHVSYLKPGFHLSHTICEVWNDSEKRWMLVDPSTGMIDFDRTKFDFSNELWLKIQDTETELNQYGVPGRYSGYVSILGKIPHDLAFLLGFEFPIYQYAPIIEPAFKNEKLSEEKIKTINQICELMKNLDAKNISKLKEIYENTPDIQITKSFMNHKKD